MNRRSFLENVVSSAAFGALPWRKEAGGENDEVKSENVARNDEPRSNKEAKTRIGNFHSFHPGGIAFIKDDAWGVVLNIGWDKTGKPGTAAPDQSIHRFEFDNEATLVTCEWGRAGTESAAIRLTAPNATEVTMEIPARPWAFFNNILWQSNSHALEALSVSATGEALQWRLECNVPITSTFDKPVC